MGPFDSGLNPGRQHGTEEGAMAIREYYRIILVGGVVFGVGTSLFDVGKKKVYDSDSRLDGFLSLN